MKTFYKLVFCSILLLGMLADTSAQRSRELRGGSGSGISRNSSPANSAPHRSVSRSAPSRSFNGNTSSRVQSQQPSRQMTVRQSPQRSLSNNSSANSTNTRNFQSRGITASRNNNNYERVPNIYRGSSITRNYHNVNYRNHYRDYHYYGTVYGHRTWFMHGRYYRYIPHNFISIHFGGYPYYYYSGCYYGYYNGYYRPIFPPFGLQISVLPFGYSSLIIGGFPYYYYNGIYYRRYENIYQVVDAPMGAIVSSLPSGARSVVINGESLYELNGTYYKPEIDQNGNTDFMVVGKNGVINNTNQIAPNAYSPAPNEYNNMPDEMKIGDRISQLPEGSKIVTLNGEQLYKTPDNIYLQQESDNGVIQYKVVGK